MNTPDSMEEPRSRSNSIRHLMSSQTSLPRSLGRSVSMNEGLHVRLPLLHHSETEPSSPLSQTNNLYDSNWANKIEDFDIGNPIGYGSSAVVYEAIYKPLKKKVAIKTIDLDMFERNQIDELRRETALMALSKHPNVLRVYGSFVNGSKLYIVTPYLAAGSCLDIMKTSFPDGLDEISIATILRQALDGLVYLHKNGHIHRDVKAGNLLMDQQGTVLLADFGVSSSLTDNTDVRKTFVGTPCWMAPEVMEQAGYNYKADIWSFGITALELATGHAPFAKYPPMKVLMMTLSNAPPTLDRENGKHKFSKAFKDMIDSCLQKDSAKRPSAEKLALHPFFKAAKRKEYLVKSILQYVLPLDQRPHKKIPQKHISVETTEQWDFDEDTVKPIITSAVVNPPTPPSSAAATPERTKPAIQFEECPKPVHVKKNTPLDESIKKHSSLGDADPPTSRKSRFVIEDNHGAEESDAQEGEFKKGRFSVNQEPSMQRVASQDSFHERKSRFEVKQEFQSFPMSREGSNTSVLSRENSKVSRFSVETEKKRMDVHGQLEILIKQNEVQKHMIQDLVTAFASQRHRSEKESTMDTIEHLHQLLLSSNKEKERLMRENEAMRKEIEKLSNQNTFAPEANEQQEK